MENQEKNSESERPINMAHAFCSLILPGWGQLLQKRTGEAIGFFVLFIVSGFFPALIVSNLYLSRFAYQPLWIHLLHLSLFVGLFFLFMLAVFWAVLDAARKPKIKQEEKPSATQGSRFTLIELLVVISIIGIFIALLLPSVPAARESARRMRCSDNMKAIVLAFHSYYDEYGHFPPAYTVDEDCKPLHSWRVLILPYIEQTALYKEIRLDEPWDSEHNSQFHSEVPRMFRCPSNSKSPTDCVYSVIDGAEAAFFGSQTRSKPEEKILSETIFLVERKTPINWMDTSQEMSFETACQGINFNDEGISSYHPGGVNCAFGDGSVRFLESTTLRKMLTFNAKE